MENGLASLDELTGLSAAAVDALDILTLNFGAGRGLPGTERSVLDSWLAKRDEWAALVRFEVRRHVYRFDPRSAGLPTEYGYGNSPGRFICWFMLQVLQEDCGVRYHPDRRFKPDFCQPRDVFAHGILDDDGEGGTCSSMPVVYVAVGRALGLPVYLVETRGHAFFRWDDPKGTTVRWQNPDLALWIPPDRFNVDGSGEGIAYHEDSFYVRWPELWKEIDIRHGRYLRSMSPKEELASFLMERGECFWDLHNRVEALKSYHCACELVPEDVRYRAQRATRARQYLEWEADDRLIERQVREAYNRSLRTEEHSPGCRCAHCQAGRTPARQFSEHGPSCQCFHCRKQRESSNVPKGFPGHPPSCQCAGCGHQRRFAAPAGF